MKINGKILLRGPGLHSGQECELIIEPCEAPEILMRSGDNELPLKNFSCNGTNRGSDYFFPDGASVRTCEHVLSALNGLGIAGGVRLTVNGPEMPALDGCSKKLCNEILNHSDKNFELQQDNAIEISEPLIVSSQDRKRFVAAFPCDRLHITYTVEYDFIGAQVFDYEHSPKNYYENLSGARTFAMLSDIEYLRAHGMALGGSLDNAIVVGPEIQAAGGLRWQNEFVRHKVLDLIGDLASLGRPLKAHLIALRAGHELHLKLAQKIKELNLEI